MKTISIRVCGDQWINSEQVREQLENINVQPTEWVCFDTGAEGISLKSSGILDTIDQWADHTHHSKDRIVINSPNNFEITPYQNLNKSKANHFFAMSGHYHTEVPENLPDSRLFGLFLGRHTQHRDSIAKDCFRMFEQHFLFSIMKSSYVVNPWSSELHNIGSLDDMSVKDQYTGQIDSNASLLKFYPQFQIELVTETCVIGETFFPTEKTIRAISGNKPMLIFGPKFFIANLKEIGFKTYDQCWDENYDCLEGVERWQAMLKIISNIANAGYNIKQAQSIAQYNVDHLRQWHQYTTPKNMPRVLHDS
jgi:hypothetical protein